MRNHQLVKQQCNVSATCLFLLCVDAAVNLSEFMELRRRTWSGLQPIPEAEVDLWRLEFRGMDADGSGSVDYWEFVKRGACVKLSLRAKVSVPHYKSMWYDFMHPGR